MMSHKMGLSDIQLLNQNEISYAGPLDSAPIRRFGLRRETQYEGCRHLLADHWHLPWGEYGCLNQSKNHKLFDKVSGQSVHFTLWAAYTFRARG